MVFQELANGKTRLFFKEFGNETGTAEEGTGTKLSDDNSIMKVTLVSKEPSFPVYFEAPITAGRPKPPPTAPTSTRWCKPKPWACATPRNYWPAPRRGSAFR